MKFVKTTDSALLFKNPNYPPRRTRALGAGEPATRARLFKIRHLGEGQYSIRSMLDSSMGWVHEGYQTSSATVGYTDADIDDNEKWVITSDELGYYIYGYMVGRVIAAPATITDGVELTSATKLSNTSQRWTLTKKSASYSEHGVYMTRKTNRLIVGQSFSFDAVFYTSNTAYNGGNTITWQKVNETGGASFDSGTRTLTATSAGTVKLTATYTKSATQQWSISRTVTIDEIFPEGVYLIENAQYGTYLQECGDGSDAVVELAEFTGSEAQLWYISSYEDGTCEIKKDVQGKVLTGYYTDNSFSHWQFRDSVGADIAMWYVVPVDDDTYQIASKANSARQIMVDTTSGDVILDTFSRDVGNEWIFHPMSENVVNLEVVYDQAYASRYSNAIDRINEQMISLREIYFFRFGIWINYSEPSVFTSYADRCNSMYTAPCTHSINCTDSNLAYVDSLHHKNITNILHHIGYPDKSITLKLAYTGHFTCSNRSGEHRYNGVRGLAYMDYGIAIVTADDTQNAEQRTAVHEFGHLYGVLDHYNQGDAPSTSDMNNEVEGAPFSSYCIYGENRSDINVTNNLSICDGCRSAIESNKNEYDH